MTLRLVCPSAGALPPPPPHSALVASITLRAEPASGRLGVNTLKLRKSSLLFHQVYTIFFLIYQFRAKINNKSELGLGYQQKLRDGVTVTLSTLVNSSNINAVISVPKLIIDYKKYFVLIFYCMLRTFLKQRLIFL